LFLGVPQKPGSLEKSLFVSKSAKSLGVTSSPGVKPGDVMILAMLEDSNGTSDLFKAG